MEITVDLTQDGLAMIFREYQVLMLKHLWRSTGDTIPVSMPPEADNRELWTEVNKYLEPKGVNRPGASRASIINTGKRFADEGIWDFREIPAKGGHHRIYHAKITEAEFWKKVTDLVVEKLPEISVNKVGIHSVDDEDAEHYKEIAIDDTKEYGRWIQTVTAITIIKTPSG